MDSFDGKIIVGSEEWCSFPDIGLPAIKARVAECVTSIERVDAALLDYGLATVMTWSPDISEAEARAAARGFFDTVGDDASSYYFQSHVTKMQGLIAN
jgi:hypothetical protein